MYTVYAIHSLIKDYIYVGQTNNLDRRFDEHNRGWERTTKPYRPFRLIFTEVHDDRKKVREREKYFKSTTGKRYLRKITRMAEL